jgi:uncharacterized membrane protein YeaQ/YmgE (transglycosylase-associated protein family)
MKNLSRIILTALAVLASFYFIFWVPFSFIPEQLKIPFLPAVVSLLAAAAVGWYIWRKTGSLSDNLSTYIMTGGILFGSIGFVAGFIGPMIFSPESNQGPLLGIFITGPVGFLVGLIAGGVYGYFKTRHSPGIKQQ